MIRDMGLIFTGTLGILRAAAHADLLSLPQAIEKLRQTPFRIRESVPETVLEEDRQRRQAALVLAPPPSEEA